MGAYSICSGSSANASSDFSYNVAYNGSPTTAGVSNSQSTFTTTAGGTTAAGTAITLTVTAKDQFANPVGSRAVTVDYSGGVAQKGETLTTSCGNTNASTGIATCSFTPKYAISRTLTVTIANTGGNVQMTQTRDINTIPATSNKLVFATQPATTSISAGTNFVTQPVVQIQDTYGNPITSSGDARWNGNITLKVYKVAGCNSFGASTAAGFVNAAGDSQTVAQTATGATSTWTNLTYTYPSTQAAETLYFGATLSGVTSVCSSTGVANSNITHAAATKLAFSTQPSNVLSGSNISASPVVQIRDTYNNRISSDNTTVITMTKASGTGTLAGTLTATASGGNATFSNLQVNGSSAAHVSDTKKLFKQRVVDTPLQLQTPSW